MMLGLFYILVPIILIGMIAFKRQPNRLIWILTILSFGSVLAYLWATARWELISIYFRPIFLVLFIAACIFSFMRIKKPVTPPKKIIVLFGIVLHIVLIVFFSGLNWFTFRGYTTPDNAIDLASPFRNGKQVVLHGGASPFTNGHFHVKPQNYALDIVGLNTLGMRSKSIAGGSNLEGYVIYGEPVFSPVNGVVSVVVDEFDDQNPPMTDTAHLAGNHVLVESEGVEILLAHLKKGSVLVKEGDRVTTNTEIGQVGNTGNTSEPHLHIHVERGGSPKTILNGKAVPFTINDRFLIRGDVIN
ncbi:MAG: peptidoglycan DD-metalloendopeptidase family protein [Maribacter sp.]|nr:peptidoglycan DD-metalloendopeptidase family protein [Maribacter sp.]